MSPVGTNALASEKGGAVPHCATCGSESPEGASFCLNCGAKHDAAAAAAACGQPNANSFASQGPGLCAACGTENAHSMRFCRNCGTTLARPPTPGSLAQPGATPTIFSTSSKASGMQSQPVITPAQASGRAAADVGPMSAQFCGHCGGETPAGFRFCQQCGSRLPAPSPAMPAPATADAEEATHPGNPGGMFSGPTGQNPHHVPATIADSRDTRIDATPIWGRLTSVNRDGSDGASFSLMGDCLDVGRSEAEIAVADDRYLAPRHARLEMSVNGPRIVPLERVNGVFKRIVGRAVIDSGSVILVGREVLSIDVLDDQERVVTAASIHGVVMFGSPPRNPWARVSQRLANGGLRDVRYVFTDEFIIGRENGDMIFRDDVFLSRRHAALTWDGRSCILTDLNSSNGTFVRITGPSEIASGDHFRIGDQLFRFEQVAS